MYCMMKKGMNIPLTMKVSCMFPSDLDRLMPRKPKWKLKKYKKLKRSYASVDVAGTTSCPTSIRSQKSIKNWREVVQYLHNSVDRARFLRKSGSVLTLDMVALKKEMEKRDTGQRQQREVAVGYCSCGAAYPSRL